MSRDRLIEQILDHLVLVASEIDRLTGAAAAFNHLNRTDLRALKALHAGGLTAGQLARALGITSGATTRVIDSLVAAGHVVRAPDPEDRRRVVVGLTQAAAEKVDRTFEQLRADTRAVLEGHTDEELETVARFLADVRSLARKHARRLSGADDR